MINLGINISEEEKKRRKLVSIERMKSILSRVRTRYGVEFERQLLDLPSAMHRLFGEAWLGDLKGQRAIKAKCLDCTAYQRSEVENCTVERCPLWAIRPFRKKGKNND